MNRREACLLLAATPAAAAQFESRWSKNIERTWIGPEYWSNPLQDWRLKNGRMECFVSGGDRNVFLLTHEIAERPGSFTMSIRLGRLEGERGPLEQGWVGFRTGPKSFTGDYRENAIYGMGMHVGLLNDGRLFIGHPDRAEGSSISQLNDIELVMEAKPKGDRYSVKLTARDPLGKVLNSVENSEDVRPEWLVGGVALVCSGKTLDHGVTYTPSGLVKRGVDRGGNMHFWFMDWKLGGDKVDVFNDRAWGPILWSMHTLSRRVMKMTVQMAPVSDLGTAVQLQTKRGSGWRTLDRAKIDRLSRTANFRVSNWNDSADVPYRLLWESNGSHTFEGTIKKDPRDKEKIIVAGLSCMNDLGFPNADLVEQLRYFKPDLLAFTGDQIYERTASYGVERSPVDRAALDYLRKWYLFGWTYRDLLRDIPSISIPDDHDVYHGNIWGAGGRKAEGSGQPGQDSGGYTQAAEWVNMVQRTQTSHLPDPFDPRPIDQDIGVYYCSMMYGGVSFAIIEDRKWKSAPKIVLPEAEIINGWAKNPNYKAPVDGDVKGAQLLGDRQIKFLEQWSQDWTGGAWMKVVFSQTIFTNLATLPPPADTDAVTPKLPVLQPGEYPPGEVAVADHDSNGWPQTPRNEALKALRKGFAFHIAGDQHLGSTIQYGVEDWNDASWAICVPAVSNLWPRRWFPPQPGKNRNPEAPAYTGEFVDGFGNKVTVHAVLNPSQVPEEPKLLNHRAPGYGIIELDRKSRRITASNWPRWVDPSKKDAKPADGWPVVIDQLDNAMPRGKFKLDPVSIAGKNEPIVRVTRQDNREIIYTVRPVGELFTPGVPVAGKYQVDLLDDSGKVIATYKDRVANKSA